MMIVKGLLEISIYSGIVFLSIVLMKKVLKDKMSPALHYGIWLLLVLRLIIPVTMDSGIHFIQVSTPVKTESIEPAQSSDTSNWMDTKLPASDETIQAPLAHQGNRPNTSNVQPSVTREMDTQKFKITPEMVLIAIWLAGMLGVGIYISTMNRRLRHRIKMDFAIVPGRVKKIFLECKDELDIKGSLGIMCQRGLSSPALLLPSTILIPKDVLENMSEAQLKMAMCHEMMHVKRKDPFAVYVLNTLKAVYWFNPIVWIAAKMICEDMETACDSMVVKSMDAPQKRSYASAVLSVFTEAGSRHILLGMALGNNKKTAERRIRGIFMRNKSKNSVRLTSLLLTALLTLTCFTTACKPVEKADAAAADKSTTTNVYAQDEARANLAGAPKDWKEEIGEVAVNAKVSTPNVDKIPSLELRPRDFTTEDLKTFYNAFFKGQQMHTSADLPSERLQLVWKLQEYEGNMNNKIQQVNDGKLDSENGLSKEQFVEQLTKERDEQVAKIKEAISKTPEEKEHTYSEPKFEFESDSMYHQFFAGNIKKDNREILLGVTSYEPKRSELYIEDNERGILQHGYEKETNQSIDGGISYKDAKEKATQMIQSVGLDKTYLLDTSGHMNFYPINKSFDEFGISNYQNTGKEEQVYYFTYGRNVGGVPSAYQGGNMVGNYYSVDNKVEYINVEPQQENFQEEYVRIVMDSKGELIKLKWSSPTEVVATVSENVTLLPFEEIQNKFKEYSHKIGVGADIDRIKLNMRRIYNADNKKYETIPVWDFYCPDEHKPAPGTEPGSEMEQGFRKTFISISAIDGRPVQANL